MTTQQIVLASSSPYRKSILQQLGLEFLCASPNINEAPLPQESPQDLVKRLAQNKAMTLTNRYPQALLIGSDQVAVVGTSSNTTVTLQKIAPEPAASATQGTIIGKPGNRVNAQAQLRASSGHCVEFFTGLCLHNSATGQSHTVCERFRVYFRELSDAEINRYIDTEMPLDCAGSFKCEGLGITLFERLEGRDYNTLIGLPLIALCDLLRNEGLELP